MSLVLCKNPAHEPRTFPAINIHLRSGHTNSCGCLSVEKLIQRSTKHGQAKRKGLSRAYQSHRAMLQRITNPNNPSYFRYGGAGLKFCERFRHFPLLFEDLGECPEGKEIDRWPDPFGNYSCGKCDECLRNGWKFNVQWSTDEEQTRHRTNTVFVTVNGSTAPLIEMCEKYGIDYETAYRRIERGWSHNLALLTPVEY